MAWRCQLSDCTPVSVSVKRHKIAGTDESKSSSQLGLRHDVSCVQREGLTKMEYTD